MQEPFSPTKQQKQLRFAEMKLIRQHILQIRQRKPLVPVLPQPPIVQSFANMYRHKFLELKKKSIKKSIQEKKKQYQHLRENLQKNKQIYKEKEKSLKEKEQLLKVLTEKLENQYDKTKAHFQEVGFNKSITKGVKNMSYYRLGEILFNPIARGVFQAITSNYEDKEENSMVNTIILTQSNVSISEKTTNSVRNEQEMGICLGYLGLLICKVGQISGARMWLEFSFRGSKSTIKLNDGTVLVMRPRENRYFEGVNLLIEQLYQILYYSLGIKIQKSKNLYKMCEELSLILLN